MEKRLLMLFVSILIIQKSFGQFHEITPDFSYKTATLTEAACRKLLIGNGYEFKNRGDGYILKEYSSDFFFADQFFSTYWKTYKSIPSKNNHLQKITFSKGSETGYIQMHFSKSILSQIVYQLKNYEVYSGYSGQEFCTLYYFKGFRYQTDEFKDNSVRLTIKPTEKEFVKSFEDTLKKRRLNSKQKTNHR